MEREEGLGGERNREKRGLVCNEAVQRLEEGKRVVVGVKRPAPRGWDIRDLGAHSDVVVERQDDVLCHQPKCPRSPAPILSALSRWKRWDEVAARLALCAVPP